MADSHHTCRTCGNQFVRLDGRGRAPIYCSRKCHPSRSRPLQSGPVCNCKLCGKEFRPKVKDRTSFCSRECGLKWTGIQASVRANGGRVFVAVKVYARRSCVVCASWFRSRQPDALCCSYDCRVKKGEADRIARDAAAHVPKDCACAECGAAFVTSYGNKRTKFCSIECGDRHARRVNKGVRSKRIRCGSGRDRIDPIAVFKRDGWRCRMCGTKTPQSLRGTTKPNAPELDHIITLADGGSHTYANVQCSCRKCNGAKGSKSQGQLLLFG